MRDTGEPLQYYYYNDEIMIKIDYSNDLVLQSYKSAKFSFLIRRIKVGTSINRNSSISYKVHVTSYSNF